VGKNKKTNCLTLRHWYGVAELVNTLKLEIKWDQIIFADAVSSSK